MSADSSKRFRVDAGRSGCADKVEDVQPDWIDLDGTVNTRDVGGLPVIGGGSVQPRRLIRSDNLQDLSEADVRLLTGTYCVRAIADLRTGVELDSEGPGPMTRESAVTIEHLSLFPESGRNTDAGALDDEGEDQPVEDQPVVLPWQDRDDNRRQGVSGVYLGYLDIRPDSVLSALRLVANSPGSTIVHCAAGKDRTGVVVALALAEVGVESDAIIADYAASADHIEALMSRLMASRTYAGDLTASDADKHRPRATTMEHFLQGMDEFNGGVAAWLSKHGWTEEDHAALASKLLG